MINLLSADEKQKLRERYHFLVLSVCLPALSVILLAAILSFLPTFFLADSNYRSILTESQSKAAVSKQSEEQGMKKVVSDANAKIDLLKMTDDARNAEYFFQEILKSRPSGVYITNFSYDGNLKTSDSKYGTGIIVQGNADNRTGLLAFVDALKSKKDFSTVDLPISSLITDTNLSYSLNIAVASLSAK